MDLLAFSLISFVISWGVVAQIRRRFGQLLLDIPNDRSSHTQPTPRGGGLGFVVAFAVTGAIAPWVIAQLWQQPPIEASGFRLGAIALSLGALALTGLLDDRYNLPAKSRYGVQLGAAMVVVLSLESFAFLEGWELGLAIALSVVAMTALINFYNFMDGLDGLVASVCALQLGFFAWYLNQPLWWLMVAALLGFLYWNWSPAKIFMGDVGSTVLGACVAIALLAGTESLERLILAATVTFPLLGDAVFTLLRRLVRGENIFQAHRTHLYQRLQQSGWSHRQVAITYLLATACTAIAVVTLGTAGAVLNTVGTLLVLAIGEGYLKRSAAISR